MPAIHGNRILDRLIIGFAAIVLTIPLLSVTIGFAPEPVAMMLLRDDTMPTLGTEPEAWSRFPKEFEAWYRTKFGFRDVLVDWNHRLHYGLLQSPEHMFLGEEGWLFLERVIAWPEIPILKDLCGEAPFTEVELEAWRSPLVRNWRELKDRGIAYVFVLLPNKHTTHARHLPDRVTCVQRPVGPTRSEQLTHALRNTSGFPLLDLTERYSEPDLESVTLWRKTDTHWNAIAAIAAHRAILDRLGIPSRELRSRVSAVDMPKPGGDLARILRMQGSLRETVPQIEIRRPGSKLVAGETPTASPFAPVVRVRDDRASPSAVVFHDSYFRISNMRELIAESFSRSVFVTHYDPRIQLSLVEEEQPDFVIHELVASNLLSAYGGE
jgi:hypothetical protein